MADPVGQTERICRHCGLSFPDELAEQVATYVDPGRQEKWRRLDRETLAQVLPILHAEMVKQGYEVPADLRDLVPDEPAAPAGA